MIPNEAQLYQNLGFKTLPITYGKKATPPPEWVHTSSQELWSQSTGRRNVALQAGHNQMFLLDPDTEQGSKTVKMYLDAKGIDAFKIVTWRGYTHYWLRTVAPKGTQWNGKLQDNMGDWRCKNGYGLAAPSFVRMGSAHGFYTLPENNPGTVPFVDWEDIYPLLRLSKQNKVDLSVLELPIPTVRRAMSQWLKDAVRELSSVAEDSGPIPISVGARHWESRSEAAMSIMMSGLLNGYSYREVMHWLSGYKSEGWWLRTTAKAVDWLSNEAERPVLTEMHNSVYDISLKDQDVLHAMISVLWYVGSLQGGVSNRDIQMLVSRGRQSVSASVSRLMKAGIIELVEKSDGNRASIYRIDSTTERSERERSVLEGVHQEVFRHGGISHTQRRILDTLPGTPKELAARLDVSVSGVYGALNRLQDKGIVRKSGKTWEVCRVSKAEIESELDAQDQFLKRKSRIATERALYHRRK